MSVEDRGGQTDATGAILIPGEGKAIGRKIFNQMLVPLSTIKQGCLLLTRLQLDLVLISFILDIVMEMHCYRTGWVSVPQTSPIALMHRRAARQYNLHMFACTHMFGAKGLIITVFTICRHYIQVHWFREKQISVQVKGRQQ